MRRLTVAPADLLRGDQLHRVEDVLLTGSVTAEPVRDGVLWIVPATTRVRRFAPAAQITIGRPEAGDAR